RGRGGAAHVMPTRRCLVALAAWLALGIAASLAPALREGWIAAGVALGAAPALDALRARRRPAPEATRDAPTALAMGVWSPVRIAIANPGGRRLRVRVHDHHPPRTRAE